MPEECVLEPLPHLVRAIKDFPDDYPPLVWVYPFREYQHCTKAEEMEKMYYEDKFIIDCINNSLPVSAVISTGNFVRKQKKLFK